jgi:hypothetical protein
MQLSCHRRNRHLNESLLSQLVKKIKKNIRQVGFKQTNI